MATVEFDFSELKEFFGKLEKASGENLKQSLSEWLEGLGIEFLQIVEDEIKALDATDSRKLIHSFSKGDKNNCWEISDGELTLEVGTHVDYASFVNDGHWANPLDYDSFIDNGSGKKPYSVEARFIPGVWNGDRFEYRPGAKTGMILKQQWIKGKPYWNNALRIIEKMFPKLLEAKLQQWLDSFGG